MQTQVYSIDEIREIVAPIAKQHGVDKVFLFGSYARGDATPASDVDLCVDAPKLRGLFALGTFPVHELVDWFIQRCVLQVDAHDEEQRPTQG